MFSQMFPNSNPPTDTQRAISESSGIILLHQFITVTLVMSQQYYLREDPMCASATNNQSLHINNFPPEVLLNDVTFSHSLLMLSSCVEQFSLKRAMSFPPKLEPLAQPAEAFCSSLLYSHVTVTHSVLEQAKMAAILSQSYMYIYIYIVLQTCTFISKQTTVAFVVCPNKPFTSSAAK